MYDVHEVSHCDLGSTEIDISLHNYRPATHKKNNVQTKADSVLGLLIVCKTGGSSIRGLDQYPELGPLDFTVPYRCRSMRHME